MTPQEAAAEADARIVEGYHVLLSENLRLAHVAMMEFAHANNDDFWPKGRDVIRFARFYGVSAPALGGLVGLLPDRLGPRAVPDNPNIGSSQYRRYRDIEYVCSLNARKILVLLS